MRRKSADRELAGNRPPIVQRGRVPGMSQLTESAINVSLPAAAIAEALPMAGPPFRRPDPATVRALAGVSSATASALMHRMGVRQTFVAGALARKPGAKVVGPIVTLQFMPKRE